MEIVCFIKADAKLNLANRTVLISCSNRFHMQRLQQVHDKYGPINLRSLKYTSAILPVVPDNDGCFVKRYSMAFALALLLL